MVGFQLPFEPHIFYEYSAKFRSCEIKVDQILLKHHRTWFSSMAMHLGQTFLGGRVFRGGKVGKLKTGTDAFMSAGGWEGWK